ncbi:MAG: type II toxin-antitoxin system RelE/ParE family toxin [Isosphaeraceae bacterium]
MRPKQQRLTMILSAAILNPFRGDPWRILFAFDPNRAAILLVGGNKRGDKRWYKKHLPIADERFREHLDRLQQ